MTLADLHELLTENGFYVSDNNDYELLTADGLPITGITIDDKEKIIYLSDTGEGLNAL